MKKHSLTTVLAAALVGLSAAAFPSAGIAAEAATTADGFQYTVSSATNEVTITGYVGSDTQIYIPSVIAGRNVTEIAARALQCKPMTKLVIPASVQRVYDSAVSNCPNLSQLEILGGAKLYYNVFQDSTALVNVMLNQNCYGHVSAFKNCPNIWVINGASAYHHETVNGAQKPVFSNDAIRKSMIRNFFWNRYSNCRFIKDYCTELCDFVVQTTTTCGDDDDWMGEAVKARMLFDWLRDNCDFETDHTTFRSFENQNYSSVFVSYGLNGIGESVCTGFSQAYQMLLTAAGIESYIVESDLNAYTLSHMSPEELEYWGITSGGSGGHVWNLIKADGGYYECDASVADAKPNPYTGFLKSDLEMDNFHENKYNATRVMTHPDNGAHPYLNYSIPAGQAALSQCVDHFNDSNLDGLLDGDWDYSGVLDSTDTDMLNLHRRFIPNVDNSYMPVHLANLRLAQLTPTIWYNFFA